MPNGNGLIKKLWF